MLSSNQAKIEIVGLTFNFQDNSDNRALVKDLDTGDLISVVLCEVKDDEEYYDKIDELREFADELNILCYEPMTIKIEHRGRIWSGSLSLKDRSK